MHRSYKVAKLDTIIDTHGNLLDIDYRVYLGERDSYKESYPTSIRYTTNSSTTPADNQAEYEIQFEVSAKGFDSQYDKRVAETAYKLDTVKVCAMSGSNCELIHKYDLYVNVNTATKVSWLEAITQCADLACDQSLPPTTFEYDFLEIGWAEDLEPEEQGWVVRDEVDNPFLESVDNGYGGLVSFDYGQWCLSTPDDPDPPFDELELDAGCGEDEWWTKRQWVVTRTLDPGVGPEQRVSHVYSDPGYRWDHDDEQPFRSFIGFGQVTADAPNATGDVRRQTTTTFSNTMYYDSGEGVYQGKLTDPLRGRVLETLSTDEPFGRPSIKTSYDYETYLETGWPDEVYFVYTRAITETDCGIDVGNHSNCATKWTEYYYDDYYQRVGGLGQTPAQYGNLTRILEYGAPDDLLRTTVRFYPINETCHIAGVYCVDHVYDGAENNDNLVASTWYAYDGAGYCGQPGSEGELTRMRQVLTVTPEVSGRKYTTQDTAYQYDDYGHVTATVVYAEAGETVISGSQVVSDSPASGDPRTSTTAYDPDHPAFAISTTNPAGHQVTTAYYGVNGPGLESQGAFFGLPSSATDANGITTYYYYDEFGRTSKIVRPGDSYSDPTTKYAYYEDVEERDLNWGSGPRAVVAMEQKTAEGQPNVWSRKLYDGLGRLIQSQTPAGDWVSLGGGSTSGHDVIQNVAYDALGQVISESLPYSVTAYAFTGSPPATPWKTPDWSQPQTTYQYDGLGQVKVITGPDGEIIRHYYGYTSTHHLWGWYESVYDQNDYAHRYKKDALGRLVVVDEYDVANPDRHTTPYGTTEYEHDAAGNLLKVTDAAANDTTMEYDLAGRKIEMVDPDMGTWYYGYDVLGNLFYQIDAERQATHFYYDELDRLTGKIYDFGPVTVAGYERPAPPPFEQQYDVLFWYDEYGTGDYGESVGQRVCMLDGSGWTEYYYDDDRGRLTAQVKEIGGAVQGPFVTQWAYDAVDRVVSMTYPDGEVVTSTYDAQGLPDSLVGDSSYVTDASYNALGQAKQIDTGNGASTTYTYYGESGAPSPTDRSFRLWQARTTVDTTDHLWLEYDYGPAGNVTEIVDKTNSNQEQTFAYDALDRLVSASTDTNGQGQYSRTYTYNAIGNLVSKAGVTYTYPTTRPHAVETTTAGGSFQYDDNGNMVSRTISGTTYTQTWTVENRLESATDTATGHAVSYSYDGDGVLVKKETVSDTTYYAGDHFEIKVVGASGPAAPTDLSAFYTVDNQISPPQCDAHLFWQPSFPLAGVTFNLFRHTTAYVPLDAAHRLASGLTSASYTDEDVEYDYYYVATAVDSIGESGPSIAYQISTPCSSQGTSSAPFGESAPGGEDAALEADARSRPAPYDACLASPDKEGCRDRLTIRPMSKADTWRLDEPEPETYASDKAGAIVRPRGTEEEAGTLTVLIDQGIDGGFENDAAGWTAVPSTDFPATSFYHDSQDSASPYSGQYAYALSNQAYGYLLSDPINVSASTAYSLTAYVRGELDAEGTYGGWIVRAYFYDGSDGELGYEDMAGGTTPAASWTEVGDALATPAGTAKLRVALFNHLGSGWVAYDDVSLVPTSGGANMVSNAGFEGSGSWSEVGHAAFPATSFWLAGAKTAAPHSGDYAYALSNQAFGYLQSDHIDVIGGDDYKLKAWVRGELDPDDSHNKWYIRARFHDSNGDYISYDNAAKGAAGTLTTSWQQKGGTVSAPANAATMRIRLMNIPTRAGQPLTT